MPLSELVRHACSLRNDVAKIKKILIRKVQIGQTTPPPSPMTSEAWPNQPKVCFQVRRIDLRWWNVQICHGWKVIQEFVVSCLFGSSFLQIGLVSGCDISHDLISLYAQISNAKITSGISVLYTYGSQVTVRDEQRSLYMLWCVNSWVPSANWERMSGCIQHRE